MDSDVPWYPSLRKPPASATVIPLTALEPTPRYEEIVRAFDGHGERVDGPADVPSALDRALRAVREGRQAVLNVICQRAV